MTDNKGDRYKGAVKFSCQGCDYTLVCVKEYSFFGPYPGLGLVTYVRFLRIFEFLAEGLRECVPGRADAP